MSRRPAGLIFFMVAAAALAPVSAHAKGATPAPVAPVVHDGVQYIASYIGLRGEARERGAYVQGWDVNTGKRLWNRLVYRVTYDEALEGDVQDVYITRIAWKKDRLVIDNDLGERFEMDPDSGVVTVLLKKSERTEPAVPAAGGERKP